MYCNQNARVSFNNFNSDYFSISNGVKQGVKNFTHLQLSLLIHSIPAVGVGGVGAVRYSHILQYLTGVTAVVGVLL